MKQTERTLSVILPAYNCMNTIDECASSVLDALPEGSELIIVDDGSQDGTREALAAYENRDNVRVILCRHKGASGARNTGLDAAKGEFVTFIDCDDALQEDFDIAQILSAADAHTDMYIFGIERFYFDGRREQWTVNDRIYPDTSAFADEYIRTRRLMIYSNCNKFYRRRVIEKLHLRFDETKSFGEDRMFNYEFLKGCGGIITSSAIMLKYLQRSAESMSSRHVPFFFQCVRELHQAKMDCFLNLSKGTSRQERIDFMARDFTHEIDGTIERFASHPEEIDENLPAVNRIVFGEPDDNELPVGILILCGCRNCRSAAQKALEIGKASPDLIYIVSGGTDADFIASFLADHGIAKTNICVENSAEGISESLESAARRIRKIHAGQPARQGRIGIAADGFRIPRTRFLSERIPDLQKEQTVFFPVMDEITSPENWYQSDLGKSLVYDELVERMKCGEEINSHAADHTAAGNNPSGRI